MVGALVIHHLLPHLAGVPLGKVDCRNVSVVEGKGQKCFGGGSGEENNRNVVLVVQGKL